MCTNSNWWSSLVETIGAVTVLPLRRDLKKDCMLLIDTCDFFFNFFFCWDRRPTEPTPKWMNPTIHVWLDHHERGSSYSLIFSDLWMIWNGKLMTWICDRATIAYALEWWKTCVPSHHNFGLPVLVVRTIATICLRSSKKAVDLCFSFFFPPFLFFVYLSTNSHGFHITLFQDP